MVATNDKRMWVAVIAAIVVILAGSFYFQDEIEGLLGIKPEPKPMALAVPTTNISVTAPAAVDTGFDLEAKSVSKQTVKKLLDEAFEGKKRRIEGTGFYTVNESRLDGFIQFYKRSPNHRTTERKIEWALGQYFYSDPKGEAVGKAILTMKSGAEYKRDKCLVIFVARVKESDTLMAWDPDKSDKDAIILNAEAMERVYSSYEPNYIEIIGT